MSSNSIRVGEALFKAARDEGAAMSRSAAQQIEHWARVGAALEACGLTVGEVAQLLKGESHSPTGPADAELWAFKRRKQQADLDSARAGRVSQKELSWFAGGRARRVKLIDSPY